LSNILGKFIRKRRGDASLREFAEKCGLSHTFLDAIEKGYNPQTKKPVSVTLDTLLGLAKGAGVDPGELVSLVTDDVISNKPSNKDVDIIPFISEDSFVKLPIYGTVKAGWNGLAFDDPAGETATESKYINGQAVHFWLKVKGDSMTGDGIMDGDLVLIRVQQEAENGSLAVAIVNGEEGTIKRIYHNDGTVILQASNPAYAPRILSGKDLDDFWIVGIVKQVKRYT